MLSHNQLTCDTLAPVADIDALEMLRVAANRLEAGLPGNSGLGESEKCTDRLIMNHGLVDTLAGEA